MGYSRVVRTGDRVVVSGTTTTNDTGGPVAVGDQHRQAKRAPGLVESALEATETATDKMTRIRMSVTGADDWPAVDRANREVFGTANPAETPVQVKAVVGSV
ncbi:Rid family hydrolase [Halorientalis sp.]|uniref:Rid family hydrolase n=1 Tax=Halorientalis sp. TaxID=1931229 RepID=UPI00263934D2|nr:Rid family hydrolase [Halorientalis sp.]